MDFVAVKKQEQKQQRKQKTITLLVSFIILATLTVSFFYYGVRYAIALTNIALTSSAVASPPSPSEIVATTKDNYLANDLPVVNVQIAEKSQNSIFELPKWKNRSVVSVNIFNQAGKDAPVQLGTETISQAGKKFQRYTIKPGNQFKPGKYRIEYVINDNGQMKKITRDFTWGVLAVNLRRSIEKPNTKTEIGLAVLDDMGRTKCDARVQLVVVGPDGSKQNFSTDDKSILPDPACADQSVTNNFDYTADYVTQGSGTYSMTVTATIPDGTRTITDTFQVSDSVPFDVERTTFPTRIYPRPNYDVFFTIIANEDYRGTVKETVPSSFGILNISDKGTLSDNSDSRKQVTWEVDWKKGETHQLGYTIDFPNVSPQFYVLGPLQIGTWSEARQWQIASDAYTCTASVDGNWNSNATWGGVGNCGNSYPGASGSGDKVIINSGINVSLNVSISQANTLDSIAFNATSAAQDITWAGAYTLYVTNGVTMNAPGTNGITCTMAVGSGTLSVGKALAMSSANTNRNTTFTFGSGATVSLLGGITFGSTNGTITFSNSAAATLNIAGTISANADTFTINSGTTVHTSSTTTINGAYTWGGAFTVDSGTTSIAGATTITGAVNVTSGTLSIGAVATTFSSTTGVSGKLCASSNTNTKTFSGKVTVNSGGTFDMTNAACGSSVTGPAVTLSAVSTENDSDNQMKFGAGTLTLNANPTFDGTGAGGMLFGQTVSVPAGSTYTNNLTNGTVTFNALTMANPTAANQLTLADGSTTTVSGTLTFTANTQSFRQTIQMNGSADLNANALSIGTPTGAGTTNISSLITCNGGSGAFAVTTSIAMTGNSTTTGGVQLDMQSCDLSVGTTTGITGGTNATGLAQITSSSGTLTFSDLVTITGAASGLGTTSAQISKSSGIMTFGNGLTFAGGVSILMARLTTSGAVTMNFTGTLTGAGSLALNTATVTKFTGATTTINPAFGASTWGQWWVVSGKTTLAASATQVTTGLQIDNGAELDNGGNLVTSSCNSTGTAGFTVNGTLSDTGGVTLNTASCVIDGTGTPSFTGTLTLTNDKTIAATANLTFPAATVAVSASTTVTNNGIFNSTGANGITAAHATSTIWTQGASSTLKVTGPFFVGNGLFNPNGAGNTVEYQGGAQAVKAHNSTNNYVNITLSGSGTKTLNATDAAFTGNFNITCSSTCSAATAVGTAISGSLTVGANATLTVPSTYTFSVGTSTSITGSLTISSTSGQKTFTGKVTLQTGGEWKNSGDCPVTFRGGLTNNSAVVHDFGKGVQTFDTNDQDVGGSYSLSISSVTSGTGAKTLTNTGTLTIDTALAGGGNFTNTGNLHLDFSGAMSLSGTFTASGGSNLVDYGAGGAQTVAPVTYHDLTLSTSGAKSMDHVATISGDLNMSGAATATTTHLTAISGNIILANTSQLTIGTVALCTITGDVTVGAGTIFTIAASITVNGQDISVTSPGSIAYSGTPILTLAGGGATGFSGDGNVSIYSLTTSGSGTVIWNISGATHAVAKNVSVATLTTLDIQQTIDISGDLGTAGTAIIANSTGTPTVTVNGSGTLGGGAGTITFYNLILGGAPTFGTSFAVKNNLTLPASVTAGSTTVTMSGASGTIVGGGATINNLTITGASTTLNTSDLTVAGTLNVNTSKALTISNGLTLTHSGATLTLDGTINGPGRLTYRSSSAFPTGGALGTNLILCFDATANDQTMSVRADYLKIEIDNSGTTAGRTVTAANGTITLPSTLDLLNSGADPSTTIFNLDTNDPTFTVTGNTTIAANSTLVAPSGGALNLKGNYTNNGAFTDSGGTVTLNGTGAQALGGTMTGASDFNAINITNTGGTVSLSNSLAAAGNFTIGAGATFSQGSGNTVTLTGDIITITNTGTFTKDAGAGILILDGVSDNQWFEDASSGAKQDLGNVQIGQSPGITKLKSDLSATSLTIKIGDTLETHGWEVTLTDYLDCQSTATLDLTNSAPNNDSDGTTIDLGGNWTMSATGTFTPSIDSKVFFNSTSGSNTNRTITTGGKAFYDVEFKNAGASNDDMVITNNLIISGATTITDGELKLSTSNPNVNVAKGVTIASTGSVTKGSGTWTFDGTTAATYTDSSSGGPQGLGVVVFNKTSGTPAQDKVTLGSSMTVDTATISSGNTLDLGDSSYTLFLTNAGAAANVLTITGTLTTNSSSIVRFTATNSGGNINIPAATYSTLFMAPGSAETYDVAAGFTVTGTLAVGPNATFTIASGQTVLHSGSTLTLSGVINGPGRLTYQSSTAFPTGGTLATNLILRFDATANDQSMSARIDYQLVEIENSGTTAGRKVTAGTAGSQTITINSNLDLLNGGADPSTTKLEVNTYDPTFTVKGNVSIAAGSTFSASSGTMNFEANFSNSGGFTHNSGKVAFTTANDAEISGDTIFYDFSVSGIGAQKKLYFAAGSTQTMAGTWTLTGTAGNMIILASLSTGNQYYVVPSAASVAYVQVSDSHNNGVGFCATYSTDTGDNNTDWQVSSGASCGIDISGTSNSNTGWDVAVAVNDTLQAQTTTQITNWTISGVTVNSGDVVTVFVTKEDAAAEATAVTQYDGTGNITGMLLDTNVLAIGSDDHATIDSVDLGKYDMGSNARVMHKIDHSDILVDGNDEYTAEKLKILADNTLVVGTSERLITYDVENAGILTGTGAATFRIYGNWQNTGTFNANSSSVNFLAGDTGHIIEAGSSSFHDVEFNNGGGGWTIQTNNMTTTGDFTLTDAHDFTVDTGRTLQVQGNYSQVASGDGTNWGGSTLYLNGSGGMYDINVKGNGDNYDTIRIGASEDVAMWNSDASTYTIDSGGCLFSEDHGSTDGQFNIYGTCNSRPGEYWDYTKDFDGDDIGGSERQAVIEFASGASLTIDNGDALEIVGESASSNRTQITHQSSGNYSMSIEGAINAQYYDFDYLDGNGLNIHDIATVTDLSDGSFDNGQTYYIVVKGTTTVKNFFNNVFDDPADGTDTNVTTNVSADGSGVKWTFFNWSGNKGGEDYDSESSGAQIMWNSDLSLTVSDNTMNLGVVNPLAVKSDNHTITVTTNAAGGYTCYAVQDDNLKNGSDYIPGVGDGTVSAGSEEYGVSCTGTDCQLSEDNALSDSPLAIASNAARVTNKITTVYYKVAISTATKALSYSQIVTITCAGDF